MPKSDVRAVRTLKPLRARQLIRRFHVLLKYRAQLIEKLGASEGEYVDVIRATGLGKTYDDSHFKVMSTLEVNKTPDSTAKFASQTEKDIAVSLGAIDAEMEKRGGLETYQRASTLGQDGKRGGDSSKQLMAWLAELQVTKLDTALEIGCLSTRNCISTAGVISHVTRIDLNSQEPGIAQQDFLKRPLPSTGEEKFNLISCSLVLNFVPRAEDRGQMVRLFSRFLRQEGYVFLVLPLPCVDNSRYTTRDSLLQLFASQGLHPLRQKETHKLFYVLFQWDGKSDPRAKFAKGKPREGAKRNNFAIVL